MTRIRAIVAELAADPTDPRHGTENGYSNGKCRCAPCRVAWAAVCAQRKAARRGTLAPDDPRHGTPNGYYNYGCPCAACLASTRPAQRARNRGEAA